MQLLRLGAIATGGELPGEAPAEAQFGNEQEEVGPVGLSEACSLELEVPGLVWLGCRNLVWAIHAPTGSKVQSAAL